MNRTARVNWDVLTVFAAESIFLGFAVLPAAAFWTWHYRWTGVSERARVLFLAMAFVPAYLLFAAGLMLIPRSVRVCWDGGRVLESPRESTSSTGL